MAQAVKTVEFPFETRITNLVTATTLAASTDHTYSGVTVGLPESSKTIRAAWFEFTVRDQSTTAYSWDGVRVGVQIDAVAFDEGSDLTGTGIANSGDQYGYFVSRDITSYFVTNYTGSSHTVVSRVRFETSTASNVGNITCKLYITYEYDDTSATHVKTVKIPLEGATSTLNNTANTNIRGTAGAAQIPNLDTFLPETSKTYKKIWFEMNATDSGAATTDFTLSVAIDSGTNARQTLEQALNTSVRFFDIWVQDAMTTNATHDFQAWSSLTAMFQRFSVILHVTYEFASSSTTIMNSLLIPVRTETGYVAGTTAANQEMFDSEFWIQEPTGITMVQSAVFLYFQSSAASNLTVSVEGLEKASGSQGTTTSTYTVSAYVQSGSHSLCHRIDLAHGGTAVALARGRNKLRLKVYASVNAITAAFGGYYIINYTSGKSSKGIGVHNVTTQWPLCTIYDGTIAGTTVREVATTNQRTPNIPQSNYYLNAIASHVDTNGAGAQGFLSILAERLSGETASPDGWAVIDVIGQFKDSEYGHDTLVGTGRQNWIHYSGDTSLDGGTMNLESARLQRLWGSLTLMYSLKRVITTHSNTFTVSGTTSGSASGTITLDLLHDSTGEKLLSTTRVGNGTYSFTWYDNTENVYVSARESSTLLGRSERGLAEGDP